MAKAELKLDCVIHAAIDNLVESGKLDELVTDKIERTVADIIDQSLRSYSDFGKALTKYVGDNLNVNFDMLDIEGYNEFILKIIQKQLDGRLMDESAKRVAEDLETLLGHPPGEISLSGLIETFKKKIMDDEFHDEEHELTDISWHWRDDGGGFSYASWDADPGKPYHACAYQIGFHHGAAFSWRINEQDPKSRLFMGPLYDFDRRLFQIYAAGTPIILDHTDVDPAY